MAGVIRLQSQEQLVVVWSAELCAPSTNQPDVCQQEPDGARVLVLSFFFKPEFNMNT